MPFECKTKTPHLWEDYIDDVNEGLDEHWMKVSDLPMHLVSHWETNHKRFRLSCEAEATVTGRGYCTALETQYIEVEIVSKGNSLRQPNTKKITKHNKKILWPMKELGVIVFLDE